MIVSVNWLKKYTNISMPVPQLAELIGARLVEIEGIEDLSEKYKQVVAIKVVECKAVEGSDHLSVTSIDDGGVIKDVERDNKGLVQVVCGAPNVKKGMTAAWLPPGSIVPETYGTKEPFVLGARKLQGYVSNGMLASAKELDLYDDHTGIVELDRGLKAGQPLVEVLELDDYLLDIENKSLTHRPDVFGIIGFAREVAGIQGKSFQTPDWLTDLAPKIKVEQSVELSVAIDDPQLADRYQAVVLGGANKATKSPLPIQSYLVRSGIRPISAVVDVTNYLMLLTGQPLHAFDYDKVVKLSGGRTDIHVRSGKKGEKLKLLDGREITLSTKDIVIAAGDKAIGLAGAMGGAETEIDDSTKTIILESATFNLYNLRTTQMRHGIFSEAITRFTKGQSAMQTAPVLAEAVRLMGEWAGATAISKVQDDHPNKRPPAPVRLQLKSDVNDLLGTDMGMEQVTQTLENVGFVTEVEAPSTVIVTPPYWRADIHIPEDVVEEIGRLNGFDTIAMALPRRDFVAVAPDGFDQLRTQLRSLLVRAGANEVLTYSFVHGDVMKKAGQNPELAYRITNSISPDLQYYRQSIVPSLLSHVHANVRAGFDNFALFELNKFHTKLMPLTDENVPKELDGLGLVITSKQPGAGAAYYEAKRYLDYLASKFGLDLAYEPLEETSEFPVTQPFEPKRSARVWDRKSRARIGVVGEFKRSVQKAFKLPEYTAGFEIAPRSIMKLLDQQASVYTPLSRFPATERDICFKVDPDVTFDQLLQSVSAGLAKVTLETSVTPVDIYQPNNASYRHITLRIKLTSHQKTLTADEVADVMRVVQVAARKSVGASVV